MLERTAEATWRGDLARGEGTYRFGDVEKPYSFPSRFEAGRGSNPEELIGSALASCFAMALAHGLAEGGHTPTAVHASASVHLDPEALEIVRIDLRTRGEVPGIDAETFREQAEEAKANCPVSKALAAVDVRLEEAVLA